MRILNAFRSRISSWLRRSQFEADLDDELSFHLEQQTAANVRQGMNEGPARREALRQFGGLEQTREQVRDQMRFRWLSELSQDTRFAARVVTRSPAFTVTTVLVLGLAIGLSTTVFSFVKAILIEPLPYPSADRLVVIRSVNPRRELQVFGASWLDFMDWRSEAKSFVSMSAFRTIECDLADSRTTQRIRGLSVTREIFEVLGIPLVLGQTFGPNEDLTDSQSLVLSHDLWTRRYDADPRIVGRALDIYSWVKLPEFGLSAWEVVGVAEGDFPFPPVLAEVTGEALGVDNTIQFWCPLWGFDKELRGARYQLTVVARLKPGVSVEQANAEVRAIAERLQQEYPDTNQDWTAQVVPVQDQVTAGIRPVLLLLVGGVGFVLLIAAANVASLQIVRSIVRGQEIAIRIALGAGRWRLMRQLVTESVLLCLLSGAVGALLSFWSMDLVRALAPTDIPRLQEVVVDPAVLGFAAVLSLLTGLLVGVLPAVLACRTQVNEALKSGGRGTSAARSRRKLMSLLVATETAVCLVLLTGAALLIRSFSQIAAVDPGFRRDRLLTMNVSLPQAKYEWKHNSRFCADLCSRLRQTPGVTAASAVRGLPMRETHFDVNLFIGGHPDLPANQRPQARIRVVEPSFFQAMEVPLLAGRLFEPADSVGEVGYSPAVLCNETMAQRYWPGESAIGKRFTIIKPDFDPMEIVGVVGDVRFTSLKQEAWAEFYYPEALFPQSEFTLLVRTQKSANTMIATVERLVRDVESDVVITNVQTMDQVLAQSLSRDRFLMLLIATFSIGAFALAVTGHYGVVAHSVSQRRHEISIRAALGATPAEIARMVLREGLGLASAGLLIGSVASLALTRVLESELYGVSATDPWTLAGAAVMLLAGTAFASWLPTLKTARVQPAEVLRCG